MRALFLLFALIGLAAITDLASAQMYLPPTSPNAAVDPGRAYNPNTYSPQSRSDNWRDDRSQSNWRNNTWRDSTDNQGWRDRSWRKDREDKTKVEQKKKEDAKKSSNDEE